MSDDNENLRGDKMDKEIDIFCERLRDALSSFYKEFGKESAEYCVCNTLFYVNDIRVAFRAAMMDEGPQFKLEVRRYPTSIRADIIGFDASEIEKVLEKVRELTGGKDGN